MNGLVYLFIALCGLALAVAAYFGLTFSAIEALLFGLIVVLGALLFLERTLRHRAEARLEKAVDDLSRLLSTDAQAGQVLSQRLNAMSDLDIGPRLEVVEADVSVLGTVIRQVAEAVSELEADKEGYSDLGTPSRTTTDTPPEATAPPARAKTPGDGPHTKGHGGAAAPTEPVIPLSLLEQAVDEGELVHHIQPIVTLPQRKTHGYHLIPRLRLEDGELADPPDFLPAHNPEGASIMRRIERGCAEQAIGIVRRARMIGKPVRVFVDLSRASLSDRESVDQLTALLSAHQAVNPDLVVTLSDADWHDLEQGERTMLDRIVDQGVGLALFGASSLRRDFSDLFGHSVKYLGVDAASFISDPARLTDFHSADISDYAKRHGVNLVMTAVHAEEQILSLLDDSVALAQGPAIAPAGPIRTDLRDTESDDLQRAASR